MATTSSQGAKRPLVDNPSTSSSGSSSPKKKKLELNFLHERFLDGKFSDITVKALGREWKLHKVILSGSPYLMSMFENGLEEGQDQVFQLQIPDQKVTAEAVDACFRSLYAFEVEFEKSNVVHILAAASFFQLDDVIQRSHEFMAELMDADTVMDYYNASSAYGGGAIVENASLTFLKNWITTVSFEAQFPEISTELMAKVVRSSDAFCLGEGAYYTTLTEWLFMKVTGSTFEENEDDQDRTNNAFDYFRQLDGSTPFLATEDGIPYLEVFRQIRIEDMLSSMDYSLCGLREHKIIPEDWIRDAAAESWGRFERAAGVYVGSDLTEENFDKLCTREGIWITKFAKTSKKLRCLLTRIRLACRKSGINRVFKIKRASADVGVKQNVAQTLWIRINLVVTAEKGRVLFSTSSGIRKISLKTGESIQLLQIGEEYDDCEFSVGINYYEF